MKHSHSHFARLRAGWQSRAVRTVVATGALALVISALPMLALRTLVCLPRRMRARRPRVC